MLKRRVALFIAVGATAASVHFAVVVALVSLLSWPPLLANPAGWTIAFVVSYSGHRRLTFADVDTPWVRSMRRFFVVSALGLAVNQAAYTLLLTQSGIEYRLALAAVLIAVAVLTFIASRHWAFRGNPAAPPPTRRGARPTDPDRG